MTEIPHTQEIEQLVKSLAEIGIHSEIRGDGLGRFVFAKLDSRAVEISRDGDQIFTEYWDGPDDSSSIREEQDDSFETVIANIKKWLSK